jgi:hypothetical protein
LERCVAAGSIRIVPSGITDSDLEQIMANLGLQDTDRALVHTRRGMSRQTRFVTDDHRLWVTAARLGLAPSFLPDLIAQLTRRGRIPADLGKEILAAVRPRYASGFVDVALTQLEVR